MLLSEFKKIFHRQLSTFYTTEEVNSLFFIVTEKVLDISRLCFATQPDKQLSEDEVETLTHILNRLQHYEPIQYIFGEIIFSDLTLKVTPSVLIPRPETEELINWIINSHSNTTKNISLLDVGTGSGVIAIALKNKLPNVSVYALDVSEEALKVAAQNAKLNKTEIQLLQHDIFSDTNLPLPKLDIIVSNPPYVRELEKAYMQQNVLNYEPELALFVPDKNPLQFYKAIIQFAKHYLKKGGYLYFEINEYLGQEMLNLMSREGFISVKLRNDIFGKNRMIKGKL